jgi:hypothetical protein
LQPLKSPDDGDLESHGSYFEAEIKMLGARYRRLTRDYFLAVELDILH